MAKTKNLDIDLGAILGASSAPAGDCITVYFPNKKSDETDVEDIEDWISSLMWLFTQMNGGVTRLPWADGRWRRKEDNEIIEEKTTIVYSFLFDPVAFLKRRLELRDLLHDFGRTAQQDAVMVEFTSEAGGSFKRRAYKIENYDNVTPTDG